MRKSQQSRDVRPVKRSFIDARIDRMLELCGRHGVALPPFALWGKDDFAPTRTRRRLIAERGMGWNVVEFKPGLFAREGLTLFTLRMGDWRELGPDAAGSTPRRRSWPRTASARPITIMWSRRKTF